MKANVRRVPSPIPKIIHPLGKGLNQPSTDNMQFFQEVNGGEIFVRISDSDKSKLSRRDWGLPTGVYEGKMWNCENKHLVWFAASPTDSNCCATVSAKILDDQPAEPKQATQ